MPYIPEALDLIWADFDPRIGRGQSGRRPALVVSPADFCRVTEFAIVCPLTSRVRPFGTSVVLPPGLPVSGEILTSHVRSIDTLARPITYAGAAASAAILDHDQSYGVVAKCAAPVRGGRQATVWRRDRVYRSRGLPGPRHARE